MNHAPLKKEQQQEVIKLVEELNEKTENLNMKFGIKLRKFQFHGIYTVDLDENFRCLLNTRDEQALYEIARNHLNVQHIKFLLNQICNESKKEILNNYLEVEQRKAE
jgi:predicted NAD/FAD-binding protein